MNEPPLILVGSRAWVKLPDPQADPPFHEATILEVKNFKSEGSGVSVTKYFVHFDTFNKRLDEWITLDRIDLGRGIQPPVQAEPGGSMVKKASASKSLSKSARPPSKTATKKSNKYSKSIKNDTLSKKRGRPGVIAGVVATESIGGETSPAGILGKKQSNKKRVSIAEEVGERIIQEGEERGEEEQGEEEEEDEEEDEGVEGDEYYKTTVAATLSKEDEWERLRNRGSMTSNHVELSRVRNLNKIQIGQFLVEAWYFSPYPQQFSEVEVVYICEFCLQPNRSRGQLHRHLEKCKMRHPPGNEIYRFDGLSFFEIDGKRQKTWCRYLCLLSKLFLDHKTLHYDVDPFMYYVMCDWHEKGARILGYFSKEKDYEQDHNVACILTLPQHQRKGYGRLLIEFSYLLSQREERQGTPEKPLSDLGLLGYRAYWTDAILERLYNYRGEISIEDLAKSLSMKANDVQSTLHMLDAFRYYRGQLVICLNQKVLESYEKSRLKKRRRINPEALPPDWGKKHLNGFRC